MLRWNVGGPGGPGSMPPPGGNPDQFARDFLKQQGIDASNMSREQIAAKMSEYGFNPPAPPQAQVPQNFMQAGFQRFNNSLGAQPPVMPGSQPPPPPAMQSPVQAQNDREISWMPQDPIAPSISHSNNVTPKSQGTKSASASNLSTTASSEGTENEEIRLSKKDKKEWINNYRAEHNCSKKEAKAAFDEEFEYDVMTHKEAKEWINNYRKTHNCSKKEAKEAFKQEFGYDVPISTLSKIGRAALVPLSVAGVVATSVLSGGAAAIAAPSIITAGWLGAGASGALGDFINGEAPDDAAYKKKA